MSAYRELIKRGDADHTQLTELEFILYTGAKLRGGDPVLSEAAQELAALRQRLAELEGELKEARQVVGYAIGTFDGYQQTASEFAAVTKMQEWQERTRAALERTERS